MTKKIALSVLCLLLTVLALFSGWKIYSEISARQREKDEFSDLAVLVVPPATEPFAATALEETTAPEENTEPAAELRDLTELFAQNPDCIGWLCVPGTQIDYPVMFTPEEPQRYLRRSFYVAYSQSGVPFLDYRCDENSNLILYGHNMRSGTMFGNLTGYTDANFAAEHPVIELQTAAGLSRYTVFAVAAVQKTDPWYDFIEASSSAGFDEQVADLLCKACYKTGIIPAYGQQLLTLSTCYGGGNGRLIVAAVKT